MKNIHVTFEDADFKKLKRAKKQSGLGWRDFLLTLAKDNDDETKD